MWMDNFVLNLPKEFWPVFGKNQVPILFRFFESKSTVVVLSASNQAEKEVHFDACHEKKIPILRRKGGGGTVVLSPGCLILTFAFYAKNLYGNGEYFHKINTLWIDALKSLGIENLSQKGISDICLGNKKVVGSSIFRKRHLLVYQGSLLVNPDLSLMSDLLCYPSRAPEYRANRTHEEFVTSLQANGYTIDIQTLEQHCYEYFISHVIEKLEHDIFEEKDNFFV